MEQTSMITKTNIPLNVQAMLESGKNLFPNKEQRLLEIKILSQIKSRYLSILNLN